MERLPPCFLVLRGSSTLAPSLRRATSCPRIAWLAITSRSTRIELFFALTDTSAYDHQQAGSCRGPLYRVTGSHSHQCHRAPVLTQRQLCPRMKALQTRHLSIPLEEHRKDLDAWQEEHFFSPDDQVRMPPLDVGKYATIIKKDTNLSNLSLIGEGGFGKIYKATWQDEFGVQQNAAVKLLKSRGISLREMSNFWTLAQNEIRYLMHLRHPNIVQFYDYRTVEYIYHGQISHVLIITEYLTMTVQDMWKQVHKAPLPWTTIQSIGRDIGRALAFLHRLHIAFHDIKTLNIMLAANGQFKLIDFGLAKTYHSANSSTTLRNFYVNGRSRGSTFYLAPEMSHSQKFNPFLVDSYAFGLTLAMLFLGKDPIDRLDATTDIANLFERTYLRDRSDPRRGQLLAIHQLMEPFAPHRRLLVEQFLSKFGVTGSASF